MKMRRVRDVTIAAALCAATLWSAPASAGIVLDAGYLGVVDEVYDPYGVFGTIRPGDAVAGTLRYDAPTTPTREFGGIATYLLPVAPGGPNFLNIRVGAFEVATRHRLGGQVYDQPADDFFGYDFQFAHQDFSVLDTTLLEREFGAGNFGFDYIEGYVGLFTTDGSSIDYPRLPSALLPLGAYDSPRSAPGGFFDVAILDANGDVFDFAYVTFRLTGLQSVPEPASALLVGLAGPLVLAWARRRRAGGHRPRRDRP